MFEGNRPSARLIGGALVCLMVLGSALGAEAATKKKPRKPVKVTRTVTLSYVSGCTADTPAGAASETGNCATFGGGGWDLTTKPTEKYATVTVTDATGRNVGGAFWEGSGTNSSTTDFCGSLKNYVVPAGGAVKLALDALGATTKCPGLATQGTVKVVFSNLP